MLQSLLDALKQIPIPLCILLIGLIYGCTNPLLTRYSKPDNNNNNKSIDNNDQQQQPPQYILQTILSWLPFAIVFGINQLGSALNIILLGVGDLKMIAPLTNTCAFFITTIVETFFINTTTPRRITPLYIAGLVLISAGLIIASSNS